MGSRRLTAVAGMVAIIVLSIADTAADGLNILGTASGTPSFTGNDSGYGAALALPDEFAALLWLPLIVLILAYFTWLVSIILLDRRKNDRPVAAKPARARNAAVGGVAASR